MTGAAGGSRIPFKLYAEIDCDQYVRGTFFTSKTGTTYDDHIQVHRNSAAAHEVRPTIASPTLTCSAIFDLVVLMAAKKITARHRSISIGFRPLYLPAHLAFATPILK